MKNQTRTAHPEFREAAGDGRQTFGNDQEMIGDGRQTSGNGQAAAGTPRVLMAGVSSGVGKTTIVCGLLAALTARKQRVVSVKCGPDYIDPMFHRSVMGIKSTNIDTFFCSHPQVRRRLASFAADAQVAVLEGVMGYYDGIGGDTDLASTYEIARATRTPVILIVDAAGMSLSAAAVVRGFLEFREDSGIKGVIFNRMSAGVYAKIAPIVERDCGIRAYGHVPVSPDVVLESRHLGLVLPAEVPEWKNRLNILAGRLEEYLDLDGILELARTAPPLDIDSLSEAEPGSQDLDPDGWNVLDIQNIRNVREEVPEDLSAAAADRVRIAVSRDEAFCFCYDENLEILRREGADLVFFSPLHDGELPKADALLLTGGYPELHACELEKNRRMRTKIREAVSGGMPCAAECGGFMYLHRTLRDPEGRVFEMAGVLPGETYPAKCRTHFGYITVTPKDGRFFGRTAGLVRGHDFHYYESTDCGDGCLAEKPRGGRMWECMHMTDTLAAGFPHLSYASSPETARAFVEAARAYRASRTSRVSRTSRASRTS